MQGMMKNTITVYRFQYKAVFSTKLLNTCRYTIENHSHPSSIKFIIPVIIAENLPGYTSLQVKTNNFNCVIHSPSLVFYLSVCILSLNKICISVTGQHMNHKLCGFVSLTSLVIKQNIFIITSSPVTKWRPFKMSNPK